MGLALGSGAARGFAHIGVLKVLAREGIPVDALSGTSSGALAAAMYAANPDAAEMEDILRAVDWKKVFSWSRLNLSRSGILSFQWLEAFLIKVFNGADLGELVLPVAVVATNLFTGQPWVMAHGDAAKAVRASMTFPGMLEPVEWREGEYLVDGGLVNPLPVDVLAAGNLPLIIGVHITPKLDTDRRIFRRTMQEWTQQIEGHLEEEEAESGTTESLSRRRRAAQRVRDWVEGTKADVLMHGTQLVNRIMEQRWNEKVPNIGETLLRSLHVMEHQLVLARLAMSPEAIVISPDLPNVALFDLDKMDECVAAGVAATEAMLPKIEKALAGI